MHRRFTEDAQKMHRRCTENAQKMHRKCTENAQKCIADASAMHLNMHECKHDANILLHGLFNI